MPRGTWMHMLGSPNRIIQHGNRWHASSLYKKKQSQNRLFTPTIPAPLSQDFWRQEYWQRYAIATHPHCLITHVLAKAEKPLHITQEERAKKAEQSTITTKNHGTPEVFVNCNATYQGKDNSYDAPY